MKFIFAFLSIFFTVQSFAQTGIIFTNAQKVDEDRYEDYDGSPYQFKDWISVNIYDPSGLAFEKMKFNYNGFSNQVEIRQDGRFVELDQIAYTKIESVGEADPVLFKRGVNGHFTQKFVEVLYEGTQRQLVRKFRCEVTEKEFNDVGKNILIKRFDPKFSYFFIHEGQMEEVKFKKKLLLKYLGNKNEVEAFLSEHKYKITNPQHLTKVIQHLDDQGL